MKDLCVSGATLRGEAGDVVTVLPSSELSVKVKIDGVAVYHTISFTVTSSDGSTGAGVLNGNSLYSKGGGKPFVLSDATVPVNLTHPSTGVVTPRTISVLNSGQKVVFCD